MEVLDNILASETEGFTDDEVGLNLVRTSENYGGHLLQSLEDQENLQQLAKEHVSK